jgi:general secretion pathway protein N
MAQAQTLRLVPYWGRLVANLEDGRSQWPAGLLAALGTPWNTLQPEGELQVHTQGVSVEWSAGRASLLGQVRVDALAMASRLSTLRPVGSYRLTLAAVGGPPTRLQLQTLEGPLHLDGSGQWTGSGWRFSGEASADPDSESALGNLLNMVGRRQGNKSLLTIG